MKFVKKIQYEVTHNGLIKIFYENILLGKEKRPLVIFINNSGRQLEITFKNKSTVIFDSIKGYQKNNKAVFELTIAPFEMIILREETNKIKMITRHELIEQRLNRNLKRATENVCKK